jgi:hypothetical protein
MPNPLPDEPIDATPAPEAPAAPEPAAPVDVQAEALAGLDKGLAAEAEADASAPVAEPVKADAAKDAPVKDEPKNPPSADEEIKSLNLKDRAAERFKELSAVRAEYEPIKAMLATEGVKDVGELKQIIDRRKDADFLIEEVSRRVGDSETFSTLLSYGETIRAANGGDRAAAEKAHAMLTSELAGLSKMLGKPVQGVYDPLAEHADLMSAVESGELDRKHAEELAGARSANKFQADAQAQKQQQTTQHAQVQQESAQANAHVQQLSAKWQAENPRYKEIYPALNVAATRIMRALPPNQWAQAIAEDYAALVAAMPAPVAAPLVPRAGAVPLRPTGSRPAMNVVTKDPMEALEQGLAAARG